LIESLDLSTWHSPFDAATRLHATAALERGAVLYFPRLRFELVDDEAAFLDPSISDGTAKNISLDPARGTLLATTLTGSKAQKLAAMIARFGASAAAVVQALLPYREVERARASFRPVEVEGRAYSKIEDDRLLHVDAFRSRPMRGRRILRCFANVAPTEPRRWHVGPPFEDFAKEFLPRLKAPLSGQSWLYEKLGVTRGRRSRYDELMLALHDAAKRDDSFQENAPREAIDFAAGSCWLAFTDQVLHAAIGGAFALEQTFHLEIDQMAEPQSCPLKILERLSGKVLI
jgi:hypothetical protein